MKEFLFELLAENKKLTQLILNYKRPSEKLRNLTLGQRGREEDHERANNL